jgi:hypothetical protein
MYFLAALAPPLRRRLRLTGVQRLHHGNARHHDRAALLSGGEQASHGGFPVLAIAHARRQRNDVIDGVAQRAQSLAFGERSLCARWFGDFTKTPTGTPTTMKFSLYRRCSGYGKLRFCNWAGIQQTLFLFRYSPQNLPS